MDCNTVLSGGSSEMQVMAGVTPNVGKFLPDCMTHIPEAWHLTETGSVLGCVARRLTCN
jgi:hypothetical protein